MAASDCYRHLDTIFRAGLSRVDPYLMIKDHVRLRDSILQVTWEDVTLEIDLDQYASIFVLGAGKATAPMALAMEQILGQHIEAGLIVVKYGHTEQLSRINTLEAGHPVPDANGEMAARQLLELAARADESCLVLTLISGGGSALLPIPVRYTCGDRMVELTLADKQEVTRVLLACGAEISEINCVRKHLSAIKGGRLLEKIAPARSISFILSDVVGDDLSSIASGLTVPDPSTYNDALAVLAKYDVESQVPERVLAVLQAGAGGDIPESLKPGAQAAQLATNVLMGTNRTALAAAGKIATQLSYNVICLTSRISGEAREVAKMLAAVAVDVNQSEMLCRKPACIISGGEPVVTLQGDGKGGRNQEMALAFLAEMQKQPELYRGVSFMAASTDGNDGPTDAAGAFASLDILEKCHEKMLDIAAYLRNNDSYHLYQQVNGLYITGPTNTNVCDLHIIIVT